jgi:uridylate kinase
MKGTNINAHACREALDKARVRVAAYTAQLCLLDVDAPTSFCAAEAAVTEQKVICKIGHIYDATFAAGL